MSAPEIIEQERESIDANQLEAIAKERPDEMFLKGSGVLKLISAIRTLERESRDLAAQVATLRAQHGSLAHSCKAVVGWLNEHNILAMQAELAQLRGFAVDVMGYWPEGYIDGGDLQDIAEKHGLLKMEIAHKPCSDESCACAEYTSCAQFDAGVECYRKSKTLLDAQIASNGDAA